MWRPIDENAPRDGKSIWLWDGEGRANTGFWMNGAWLCVGVDRPRYWAPLEDLPPGLAISNSLKVKARSVLRVFFIAEDGTEQMTEFMTGIWAGRDEGKCVEIDAAVLRCEIGDAVVRALSHARKF